MLGFGKAMSAFENCKPETDASVEKYQPEPVRCGCGGEAKVETDHDTLVPVEPIDWKRVRCSACNIRTTWRHTEAEAIQVWNRAMRRAKVDILPNTSEDKGEMPFCPHCGDELEWE